MMLPQVRDSLIHRRLEDPLISLSTIKDDDYLTAYKIPKQEKKTVFIQLVHRRQFEEQYVSYLKHCITCYLVLLS